MNFSEDMHYFPIEGNLYGGQQPPYRPEFDHSNLPENPEWRDFQELKRCFQVFVDLRETWELPYEYAAALPETAIYEHFPIRDVSVPADMAEMQAIIDRLEEHLAAGRPVYLHCHGGRGRTGTVAGCFLAHRHHLTGEAAQALLTERFAGSKLGRWGYSSPETLPQADFIRRYANWRKNRSGAGEQVV